MLVWCLEARKSYFIDVYTQSELYTSNDCNTGTHNYATADLLSNNIQELILKQKQLSTEYISLAKHFLKPDQNLLLSLSDSH